MASFERNRVRLNQRTIARTVDPLSNLRMASKSIWQERYTKNFRFYCPMCAAARQIGIHPKPGQPIHFVQVGITTVVFALGLHQIWPWIGVKALVAFVPFWIVFEIVYRAKVRASVTCQRCGFDPVLYLSDIDRTREAIREHWRKRFEEKGIPFPGDDASDTAPRIPEESESEA